MSPTRTKKNKMLSYTKQKNAQKQTLQWDASIFNAYPMKYI